MYAPKRMNRPGRVRLPESTMFPHTITIYNVEIHTDKDTMKDTLTNHITILRGVLLDAVKAVNVRESGLEGADAATLYIPFGVEAVDGKTGVGKKYVPPLEFWRAEDRSGLWTISDDKRTFFVKGEAVEPDLPVERIETLYEHVYDVTKIDKKDFGRLAHWEVGAN